MTIRGELTVVLCATGLFIGCGNNETTTPVADANGGGNVDAGNGGEMPFTGVGTLAGMAAAGYVDGPHQVAKFSNPVNVAYRDGKLYVADFDNDKLRVIDVSTGDTSTVIAQQGFSRPFGLAFASDGTLYVSTDNDQAGNHSPTSGTIWKVDPGARTATVVASAIGRPRGIAVLPDGRIAVADCLHHVVELVEPSTRQIKTIAGAWDTKGVVDGPGSIARFSAPYGIAVRSDGKLIVTDFGNHRIRLVGLDGATTTLSGATGQGFLDGAIGEAKFNHPQGIAIAANDDIYITDRGNFRVRRISGNRVETIAGNGRGGYRDSEDRLAAELYGLEGLAVVPDGSIVYLADGNRGDNIPYNRIRQIKLD